MIRNFLQKEDWMVTVDLKDAYLSIPITAAQWNLLRLKWLDQTYEFRCLLLGLNSAPRVFTKVLNPILALI